MDDLCSIPESSFGIGLVKVAICVRLECSIRIDDLDVVVRSGGYTVAAAPSCVGNVLYLPFHLGRRQTTTKNMHLKHSLL
jgi:hypothetical protein